DLRLPDIDGCEATRQIRNVDGWDAPIVAVTASAFAEEEAQAIASGCAKVIRKPYRSHILFTVIGDLLNLPLTTTNAPSTLPNTTPLLSPEDLATLDPDWRRATHEAARAADSDALAHLLSQISEPHPTVVHSLQALINQFRYDRIEELLA
ncbi:MAG: response regulator, partial [Myxococcota bacterium]